MDTLHSRISHRSVAYLKDKSSILALVQQRPLLCDLIVLCLFAGMVYGLYSYFQRYHLPLRETVEIDLSFLSLPKYTFFSLSRGLCGYLLSLVFSIFWGFWAAKDRVAEKVLLPLLDVLQSIPILGFMPALVLSFVALFPKSNTGLELAAIVMIFTSQAWNMAFGVYHSLRIIPQDKIDCAEVYRFTRWQRIKWLELPYTVISLIWNSIMSMAGGWFFLIVNEAFQLGSHDYRLPGLGSYMSVAAAEGDVMAMAGAIVAMICLILFLDYFLWKPLVAWSQKFRLEETGVSSYSDSLFFQVLLHSTLIGKLRAALSRLPRIQEMPKIALGRTLLWALLALLAVALGFLLHTILPIPLEEWIHLGRMAALTFGRVFCCIVIGASIALPLGLAVGLSDKLCQKLEPVIQVTASFPATLLFPIMILLFMRLGISLQIGSIVLMLLGSQWYILFNVIAGTKAMPSDLKEVAISFKLKKRLRFLRLYLPAVFPYLVTGLIAAAGGAWNTSIVAEYVSYKSRILEIPGIGATINESAQSGDIPRLVASILVMAIVVVGLNYAVWLRLYHYSEKRFSLNY